MMPSRRALRPTAPNPLTIICSMSSGMNRPRMNVSMAPTIKLHNHDLASAGEQGDPDAVEDQRDVLVRGVWDPRRVH